MSHSRSLAYTRPPPHLLSPLSPLSPQVRNYPNLMAFPPWVETCMLLMSMVLLFANEASQVCLLALQQAAVPPSYDACASCVQLVFPSHGGSSGGRSGDGCSALLHTDQGDIAAGAGTGTSTGGGQEYGAGALNKLPALFIGQTLQVAPHPITPHHSSSHPSPPINPLHAPSPHARSAGGDADVRDRTAVHVLLAARLLG